MSLDSIDVDGLERKDRAELATIAEALGGKPTSRTKKADIIAMILDLAGVTGASDEPEGGSTASPASGSGRPSAGGRGRRDQTAPTESGGDQASLLGDEQPDATSAEPAGSTEVESTGGDRSGNQGQRRGGDGQGRRGGQQQGKRDGGQQGQQGQGQRGGGQQGQQRRPQHDGRAVQPPIAVAQREPATEQCERRDHPPTGRSEGGGSSGVDRQGRSDDQRCERDGTSSHPHPRPTYAFGSLGARRCAEHHDS